MRYLRISLKAAAVYVAFSLLAGYILAEMTLHPGRIHPDQARIAAMYAPYGAELQPVSIHAADGV